jgi:hypothetical protein
MAKKTLGRRESSKAAVEKLEQRPNQGPAKAGAKEKASAKAGAKAGAKANATAITLPETAPMPQDELLGAHEQGLLDALVARTQLSPREVLSRALAAYAAAVAPALAAPPVVLAKQTVGGRLFVAVDGRKEIEIPRREFVFGSAEGVDVRLDLPLIAPRHARVLWKEDSPLFEDLRSPRGSFRHGQPVDVRMLESGDEIDLGGFLPLRFRLA